MDKWKLVVLLVDAKGLSDSDFLRKCDPYCIIEYKGQEQRSTTKHGAGKNPVWNETYEFTVNGLDSSQHILTLNLWDHDTFSRDDPIGKATINVTDLIAIGIEDGNKEQHPAKYNIVLPDPDKTYCGEIKVGVSLKPAK